MLGLAVMSVLGIGTFKVAQHLENKKNIRVEQENVQMIAQRVGAAYSSLGRYPTQITSAALEDRLLPIQMISGGSLRSAWGSSVGLSTTTIDGRANTGLEIAYASVPAKSCAPLAMSAGSGMFNVEINGTSVLDSDGNVDPLLSARECGNSASQVVFTYYSGASGLALAAPPGLCVDDPSNPLCSAPAPPASITPPPPSAPPVVVPATYTQTGSQTGTCPGALITTSGSSTFPQSRSRTTTYSCPDPWGAVVSSTTPWSPWSPTAGEVCFTACVAPPTTNNTESQTASCPPGQVTSSGSSTFGQTRTRTNTYACPTPTGSYSSNPATYTPWGPLASAVCAPSCSAPPPERRPAPYTAACPAGWTGTHTNWMTYESRTWSCPSPTGPATVSGWAWGGTPGSFVNYGDCVAPPACGPAPAPGSRTLACPAGQVGSITQTHGWNSAAAPTCWVAGGWTTTSNTCATPPPPTGCAVLTDRYGGTMDAHDAYYGISYSVNGAWNGCSAYARDGDTYTISGSQTGWGGGAHDYWGWDYEEFTRRSGAACGNP